jgi:hypothetical protein
MEKLRPSIISFFRFIFSIILMLVFFVFTEKVKRPHLYILGFSLSFYGFIFIISIIFIIFIAYYNLKFIEFKTSCIIIKDLIGKRRKINYIDIKFLGQTFINNSLLSQKNQKIIIEGNNFKKLIINPLYYSNLPKEVLEIFEKHIKKKAVLDERPYYW